MGGPSLAASVGHSRVSLPHPLGAGSWRGRGWTFGPFAYSIPAGWQLCSSLLGPPCAQRPRGTLRGPPPAPHGMSAALETLGYLLAALGLLMLGASLPHSQWRVSTVHGSVITTNTIFENLWYSCATDSMGVYNCREFPSLLALSGYLQACRALMITAVLMGGLGVCLGALGLRCTNIGGLAHPTKARLAATAGALHILAGLCGLVAVSWYAANITREFFDPLYPGTKYELGPALYLGWSAALLALLGGLCLCLSCCGARDANPAARAWLPYKAPSKPAASLPGRQAATSDELDSSFGKYGKNAYV